jgi:hypothetical protein
MMISTSSGAQPRKKSKSDLVHLRSLPSTEPATSTGRVAWIWPEIEAGLATGKKLREVWDAARLDGLDIPYAQFRVYVSRLRSRRSVGRSPDPDTKPPRAVDSNPEPAVPLDPFQNLRQQREKKQSTGFHYDPFPIQKDLID